MTVSTPPPKSRKNWLAFLLAILLGLFAAYATSSYLSTRLAEIEAGSRPEAGVAVVVAKAALAAGSRIDETTVAVREIPRSWVHSNAITPEQYNRAEGLSLAWPAAAGEALLWAQLATASNPNFSARLQRGQRAVTVPVDEISSLSGMIVPGDRIDIVVTLRQQMRNFTFTLLQGITVLATGNEVDHSSRDTNGLLRSYTTLTLDTNPEDAKRIIAAREVGRITALLRAPGDDAAISARVSESEQLLGLPGNDQPRLSSVPVIYGGGPIDHGLQLHAVSTSAADDEASTH